MRRALLGIAIVLALVAAASPASAIIGGVADGSGHPNVGIVVAHDANHQYLGHCTGTLITPTVVLTAAHCFDPSEWAPDVPVYWHVGFFRSIAEDAVRACPTCHITNYVDGTPHADPRYLAPPKKGSGTSQFWSQVDFDLAVIVLDRPASDVFPGIQPAPIVGLGGLDQFATGTRNRYFTDVGYGLQREFVPPVSGGQFMDYSRNVAITPLHKLTELRLELQGTSRDVRGTGGICSGDSGGPTFLGSTIVAVHSYGQQNNLGTCNNTSGNVRLDTASARSFLAPYVSLP